MLRHGLRLPVRRASVRCVRSISGHQDPVTALLPDLPRRPDDARRIARPVYRPFPGPVARSPRDGSFDRVHHNLGMHIFTLHAGRVSVEWNFARTLADAPFESQLFLKTMNLCRVTLTEYASWKPVVLAPTFREAASLLKADPRKPPNWLLFHLFINRTASTDDALHAVDTLLAMQSELAPDTLAGCIIAAIHALAQVHVDAIIRPLVTAFLRPDVFPNVSALYVNAMLVALSRCSPSEVLAPLISQLVSALHARGIKLESFAVEHLLASKSNTLELTQRVHRILVAGAPTAVERAVVHDFITVLQKDGAPGSVALVLTALVTEDTAEVAAASHAPGTALTFPPHFPPNLPTESFLKMTVFEWISYVAQAARDKSVPADTLLEVYAFAQDCVSREPAHRSSNLSSLRRKLFPALLAGLVRRGAAPRAVALWDEYVARHLDPATSADPLKLDRHILGAGVHALSEAGRTLEALATLDALALRVGEAGYAGWGAPYAYPSRDGAPRVPLSSIALNAFLGALLAARRPDAVFALWDVMEPAWGVAPDGRTLDVLLAAAALAGRMHAARPVREEIAYIRFRMRALLPWGRRAPPHAVGARGSDDDPVKMVRALLAERCVQSTLWRGAPAWQRARYVFRSVVLGNWPELASVVPPAHALREGEPVEFAYGERDPAAWTDAPGEDAADAADDVAAAAPEPRSASTLLYPSTTPSAKTFHLYILLLGQSGLAVEIAEALAWMRQLGLVPTTNTLAMALVYWRTVTDDAPSVEIYKDLVNRKNQADEPLYGSQYVALVQWLNDWVPRRMPTEGQIRAMDHFARGIIHRDGEAPP